MPSFPVDEFHIDGGYRLATAEDLQVSRQNRSKAIIVRGQLELLSENPEFMTDQTVQLRPFQQPGPPIVGVQQVPERLDEVEPLRNDRASPN